jgi:hypothetical protein
MKNQNQREAERVKAFLSDGDVGSTQMLTEAVLTMALRAHIQLEPDVAAALYLAARQVVADYHDKGNDRMPSPFEVDGILSICEAHIPVLNELERYNRILLYRKKKGGKR